MNGAKKDYKFGQKNNWRRHVWNEISGRIANRKNAVILYLAGEQDLDRKVAVEHGFQPDNMIIVERDKKVAEKLRAAGKTVIEGDLLDVLKTWGNRPPVDVIIGDFCSGLEPDLLLFSDPLYENPNLNRAVVMLNLMRGRDKGSELIRAIIDNGFLGEERKKNRASQYLSIQSLMAVVRLRITASPTREKTFREWIPNDFEGMLPDEQQLYMKFFVLHKPELFSYHSGPLCMDSVVFQLPTNRPEVPWTADIDWSGGKDLSALGRRISAALAVRTMRKGGRLAHSPEV